MSSSSRAPVVLIGGVSLLLGALFIYLGGSTVLEQWRYRREGVRIDAIATGKALRRATTTTDTAYEIDYQFTPSGGEVHRRTERVAVPVWERVEQGSSLSVEYVAGAPASARVISDRSEDHTAALGWLGVGAVLVLLVLIAWVVELKRGRLRAAASPGVTDPAGRGSSVVGSQPRSFWHHARGSFGFWFGGIALLIGLPWFVVNGVLPFHDDWRFAHEGLSTTGIVLTKEIRWSGKGSHRTPHYEATYRFAVSGERIEGRDELSLEDWQRLIEREPAAVLYRPQRPWSNRLPGDRPWITKSLFSLLGFVLVVVGGTVFVRSMRHARLVWHLRQHGVSTHGTVTGMQDLHLKLNGAQQWRLRYEYRDVQGHLHLRTFDMPQHEADTWKVGDVGGVLYDAARPTGAMWLGREKTSVARSSIGSTPNESSA